MKSVREIEAENKMNELETLTRASLLVRLGAVIETLWNIIGGKPEKPVKANK